MRHTFLALAACLSLTATSVWAADPVMLRSDESIAMPASECGLSPPPDPAGSEGACVPTSPPDVVEGVEVCRDHDPTVWHPLVERGEAGVILCTYGHEHHQDPSAVDDLFGPVGAWAGVPGQSISYPWQTSSAAGPENVAKHQGYKWYVERDQPCRPLRTVPPLDGCFRSWRIQVHSLGTASDATVRFHSFSMEAIVEQGGRTGLVRGGGHLDGGHLSLEADVHPQVCPPLASSPTTFACGARIRRQHSGANLPPPLQRHNSYIVNWYANHNVVAVAPQLEEWGPIDYQNPSNQLFYPPNVRGNNSSGRMEIMAADFRAPWLRPFTTDGVVNFTGFLDRHGDPVTGCTSADVDCVPTVIEGGSVAQYQLHGPKQQLARTEHDVASPVTGRSLIRFPN